jgi:hypothetical protein
VLVLGVVYSVVIVEVVGAVLVTVKVVRTTPTAELVAPSVTARVLVRIVLGVVHVAEETVESVQK